MNVHALTGYECVREAHVGLMSDQSIHFSSGTDLSSVGLQLKSRLYVTGNSSTILTPRSIP